MQMDTHTVIIWCPGKHRQVHCMQHRSVHTGAPSRCWGKGTHVEIQITWLHPHSVSKAMETGPWSGGAILVPRGAGGDSGACGTLSRDLCPLIFLSSVLECRTLTGKFSYCYHKGGRVVGLRGPLVCPHCRHTSVSSSNISSPPEACPGHQQNRWGGAPGLCKALGSILHTPNQTTAAEKQLTGIWTEG